MQPIEPMGDDGSQPFLLVCQRLTDGVLHQAVAWRHDALLFQRVHEFSEDKDGLCGNPGRLLCFLGQGLTLPSIARTVTEEFENHALLPQPRHLDDIKIIEVEIGQILSLDKPCVLCNFWKIEHKKHVVRFEVPKL
jgi:hypothetical protein